MKIQLLFKFTQKFDLIRFRENDIEPPIVWEKEHKTP